MISGDTLITTLDSFGANQQGDRMNTPEDRSTDPKKKNREHLLSAVLFLIALACIIGVLNFSLSMA